MDDLDRIDVNGDSTLMLMLDMEWRCSCVILELFWLGSSPCAVRSVETQQADNLNQARNQVDRGLRPVGCKDPHDMD